MTTPRSLGRFELISTLGRGGMGTVYLAKDPVIGRRVAIKEILVDPTGDAAEIDQQYRRFVQEFRSAGGLSHPNIVTIYDVGQVTGSYFIAMELVTGQSLAALLKQTPRPAHARALSFAGQVAEGLDHAHQQGVLHRDVKPANILVTGEDRVKLTDFGIAKLLGADVSQPATVVGTPGYMSPEQVRGRPIDGRSDQFALAVLLYQMVVGLPPYKGDSMSEVIYQLLHHTPKPPSQCLPELPATLDHALLHGLAQDPEARYGSCRELVAAVTEGLAGRQPAAAAGGTTLPASSFDPRHHLSHGLDDAVTQPVAVAAEPRRETDAQPDTGASTGKGASTGTSRTEHHHGASRRLLAVAAAAALVLTLLGWALLPDRPSATSSETATVEDASTVEDARTVEDASTEPSNDRVTPDPVAADPTGTDPAGTDRTGTDRPGRTRAGVREDAGGSGSVAGGGGDAAPTSMTLRITSDPAGATLLVDGVATGAVTPTEVAFPGGRTHRLGLQLAGHETAGWRFTLDELTDDQRTSRTLHFPLQSAGARGTVAITADYPVAVHIGDRRYAPAKRHEIALDAGRHAIELSAREVFLARTFPLHLKADERTALRAPSTVRVLIAAQPGNCTVTVDGRALSDAPPLDLDLVAGQHVFVYTWPNGKQRRIVSRISGNGQRVFGTPP